MQEQITLENYQEYLDEVCNLWNYIPGSPEHSRFEELVNLICNFEDLNFPIEEPDPIEAILFRLEQEQD